MVSASKDLVAERDRRRTGDRLILAVEAAAGIAVVAAIVGKTYGFAPTLFFILTAVATAFAGYMIFKMGSSWKDEALDAGGKTEDLERIRLEHEKSLLLYGIKELEADVATGKVDRLDYAHLRQTAEARAIEIIHTLKESDAKWMREAEALVKKRLGTTGRAASPTSGAEKSAPVPASPSPGDVLSSANAGAAAQARAPLAPGAAEAANALCFDDRPVDMISRDGAIFCDGCTAANALEGRFCVGCGRPRAREPRR